MKQFTLKPEIYSYKTAVEFAKDFNIGKGDLVITNEYIYQPFLGALNLECEVLYQERYGKGEPSDDMVEAMYADIKTQPKRIIAIGGGTVIDISKIFALKNVSPVLDLYDQKLEIIKDKELVLVPTTCGTGSEVPNAAIQGSADPRDGQGPSAVLLCNKLDRCSGTCSRVISVA